MNFREAAEATVTREQQALHGVPEANPAALLRTVVREPGIPAAPPQEASGGLPDALAYIKSYYKIRAVVGTAGWALPIILIAGGLLFGVEVQTSLSAYYHTSMGDFFVTVLVVVGVLLMAYRLSDTAPDNIRGTVAGAAAFGVAFFPTARDLKRQPDADLSALQAKFTEPVAQVIHFACAIALIFFLARICTFFAEEELAKDRNPLASAIQKIPSAKWSHLHRLMAYIIYGALVFVGVFLALERMNVTLGDGNVVMGFLKEYYVLLGEAVAVFAFGVSWFIKGLDFKVLRAGPSRAGQL